LSSSKIASVAVVAEVRGAAVRRREQDTPCCDLGVAASGKDEVWRRSEVEGARKQPGS
jgi:hypothetical protein